MAVVQLLLNRGAAIEGDALYGETPLCYAAWGGDPGFRREEGGWKGKMQYNI